MPIDKEYLDGSEERLCTDLDAVEERIKRELSGHIYAAAAIVITVLTLVNLVLA